MASLLIETASELTDFFNDKENSEQIVKHDMFELFSAKLGSEAASEFFVNIDSDIMTVSPEIIFSDDERLSSTYSEIKKLSYEKISHICSRMIDYLKENSTILLQKSNSRKLNLFIKAIDNANSIGFINRLKETVEDVNMLIDVFDDDIIELMNMDNRLEKTLSKITI